MTDNYFKYKSLTLTASRELDERTLTQVIDPIINSYYFLPTRDKLNDPNEGAFQNQIATGIAGFMRGVTSISEKNDLARPLYELTSQISQSTDKSGVFSLSRNVTDELLWAHYGASHCGIAIEYDLELLTRFSSRQHLNTFDVAYSEQPPSLDMQCLQRDSGKAIRNMLGHKSSRWNYEQEFRIVLENINGKVPHDYRAVKSITFGLNVPNQVRQIIFEKTRHKVVSYFEIFQVSGTYQLERKLITDYHGELTKGLNPIINWEDKFDNITGISRERLLEWAQDIATNDPHFKELQHAERSAIYRSKAVLQYEAQHELGLEPWTTDTKHYFDLIQ